MKKLSRSEQPAHSDHTIVSHRSPVFIAVICFTIVTAYTAYLGFPSVFTGSAPYDDEGYLLSSLRSFVSHGGLYSTTYSQYGPGYYAVFGLLFRAIGTDLLSLVPGRTTTLVLLVAGSLAGAIAVWLASRRLLVAIAAQLFFFAFLRHAVAEPLHPGGYLVFLLALLAVVCLYPHQRQTIGVPVAMGIILALMITTKVNVGAIALAGCLLAVTSSNSSRSIRRISCVALVLLPVGLTAADLHIDLIRAFTLAIVVGVVAAHVTISHGPSTKVRRREALGFSCSFALTSILACAPILVTGTSIGTLFRGALLVPTRLRSVFILPYGIEFKALMIVPALVLFGAALVAHQVGTEPGASRVVGVVKLLGGLLVIVSLSVSPSAGLPGLLLLTTLAAVPLRRFSDDALLGRRILVVVAVLQPLHAYPVAGSQVWWGSFLIALVAFINVADGLLEAAGVLESAMHGFSLAARVSSVLSVLLLVTVVVDHHLWPADTYRLYDKLPALDLPGVGAVRIDPAQAEEYTSIVKLLRANCDSFYSIPGLASFQVFTQLPSATGRIATAWPTLFDDQTQAAAAQDLSQFKGRLCVLKNDAQLASWQQGQILRPGPLVRFVHEFSYVVGQVGDYVVLVRPPSGP